METSHHVLWMLWKTKAEQNCSVIFICLYHISRSFRPFYYIYSIFFFFGICVWRDVACAALTHIHIQKSENELDESGPSCHHMGPKHWIPGGSLGGGHLAQHAILLTQNGQSLKIKSPKHITQEYKDIKMNTENSHLSCYFQISRISAWLRWINLSDIMNNKFAIKWLPM